MRLFTLSMVVACICSNRCLSLSFISSHLAAVLLEWVGQAAMEPPSSLDAALATAQSSHDTFMAFAASVSFDLPRESSTDSCTSDGPLEEEAREQEQAQEVIVEEASKQDHAQVRQYGHAIHVIR